jgi:para-nitrobenzyl esterase
LIDIEQKPYQAINRIAKTEAGLVRGIAGNNPAFTVFRGVPYAAPPVGDLRWREPQPVAPWSGIRDAVEFGPIPMQMQHKSDSFYGKEFYPCPQPMSEDCLYLNIWTPAKTGGEKYPVMLWIHGGGYLGGYGHEMEFDGEAFCREGVILVTINYRVGILGFFAHPRLSAESEHGVSGNYGHFDQIAALKWVRRNISSFGGDPDNITVFGQSAGAGSTQAIMNSPLAEGDISKVILQSGVFMDVLTDYPRTRPMSYFEQRGAEYMDAAGCDSIDSLRRLSYDELIKAAGAPGLFNRFSFGTAVDGYLLCDKITNKYLNGSYPDIPYLFGSTRDESLLMFRSSREPEKWIESCRTIYGDYADDFLRITGEVNTPEDVINIMKQLHILTVNSRILAELQIKNGRKPAYLYFFDRNLPGSNDGSFHSSELWYVFGTLYRCWRPMTGIDYDISSKMVRYWANFARTGDPNGEGLPVWSPYTANNRVNMYFGDTEVKTLPIAENEIQRFARNFGMNQKPVNN